MKRTLTLFMFLTALLSCKENNSQTTEDKTVQHDTVQNNKLLQKETEGSIISEGEYIQHYKNGVTKMRGMMKAGQRDGLWKSFYENGSPWSETTFSEGKKHGKTTTWYENEQKRYEGFYNMDKESGKWKFWDEKGKLVSEMDYDKQ
jgi:antitoxin component YwqK of YwqJK toxin-antitoxin module